MLKSALHKRTLLTVLFHLIGWGGFLAVAVPPASAQFKAWVMAKFPDRPWGLGIDSKGNIYTSLIDRGEVVMIKDEGSYDHIAWVPSKEESGKGGLLAGIDLDKADNIYVIYKAGSKYDEDEMVNPLHPACRDATVTRSGSTRSTPGHDK